MDLLNRVRSWAEPAKHHKVAVRLAKTGAEMRARTIGMAFLIALAVVLACSSTMAQGNPSKGLALSQRWCSQCHGVVPDEGSHNPDAPRFVDVAAERSATEYSLRVFFRTPHATMPNFVLNPDDIEDIISYILAMKPKR